MTTDADTILRERLETTERVSRSTRPGGGSRLMLHVFPSFGAGGVPIRMTAIVNQLGARFQHAIVACDRDVTAFDRFDNGISVVAVEPPAHGAGLHSSVSAALRILRERRPAMLLTYNWGSIEWALAGRFIRRLPHIHFESGFGSEESNTQIPRRIVFRRVALASSNRVVVPSQSLMKIAREVWRLDARRLVYIPNGVDCDRFAALPDPSIVNGFAKASGELIVGTVVPLRPEKNLKRLIRAFAAIEPGFNVRLLLVGEGTERGALVQLARELGVADRTVFAGYVSKPEKLLGLIDVFALTSDTEQMPNAILQAMAAGRPIVATDVGDVRAITSPDNHRFITPIGDDHALQHAMSALLRDAPLRAALGRTNSLHVREYFPMSRMFQAYSDLFESALRGK
jgi:L-malate glycosyltransferase